MAHFVTFVFLKIEEKIFPEIFSKFSIFVPLGAHTGVPVRAQKLQYVAYNIFRSHQKRTKRTKVIQNQKMGANLGQFSAYF